MSATESGAGERTLNHGGIDEFNAACPVGTAVLAFPGSREGRALMTRTRSTAWLVGSEPVVMVEGYAGGIALTHIEVIPATPDADDASEREPSPVDGGDWPDDPAASTDASGALTEAPVFECRSCGKKGVDDGADSLLGWSRDEDGELSFCAACGPQLNSPSAAIVDRFRQGAALYVEIKGLLYAHREGALTCYDHPEHYCCACGEHMALGYTEHLAAVLAARESAAATRARRSLVSRLGFGDGITEPMADDDTIVAWFDERCAEASEWRESQRWRDECASAGHSDDEDCHEHDPQFAATRARAEGAAAALRQAADDARWMAEPTPPDCSEWATWLDARAARIARSES